MKREGKKKKSKTIMKIFVLHAVTSLFCQDVVTSFMSGAGLNAFEIKNICKFTRRPLVEDRPVAPSVGVPVTFGNVCSMKV